MNWRAASAALRAWPSWKGLAEMLLRLLPPLDHRRPGRGRGHACLDAGAACRARDRCRQFGEDGGVRRVGSRNETALRIWSIALGDLEELPLDDGRSRPGAAASESASRVASGQGGGRGLAHSAPGRTHCHSGSAEAQLRRGSRVYADVWLGFSQVELMTLLRKAHSASRIWQVVHREEEAPHFETILAVAVKPKHAA